MKTKKIIYLFVACTFFLTACENFLNTVPNDRITGNALTAEHLPSLTAPLYNKVWFDFNGQFHYGLGDGMSYNLNAPYSDYIYPFADLSVTGLTGPLVNAWSSFYIVVQQSNVAIKTINASNASEAAKQPYIAEARFMRGLAYWHLCSLWSDVVISDDPTPLTINPVVNANPQKDVYEFAIRDLEYAAKYLPETSANGRVNRYSAFALLSRMYLAYSGLVASNYGENYNVGTRDATYLNLAKKAAEKVIEHSAFQLMDNYDDLFKIENNNNSESIFALQWVPGQNSNTGYGVINTQQAYFAFGSIVTGDDAAWGGGGTGCPYNMIKEYELNDTIRRKATWMGNGDFYPHINKAEGGLLYDEETFSAAPRWLSVKKGVTGSNKDNPAIGRMNSALNTYMIRLAEVYLNYAEAILGNNASTTDATALEYFNAIRLRAGLIEKNNISWEDIRYERRIEFCMEGRYWYDLLSRSYYARQEIIDYINNVQQRGRVIRYLFTAPNDLRIDTSQTEGVRPVGKANNETFRLPYPESERIQNPKLGEPPVPYVFSEGRITDLFD